MCYSRPGAPLGQGNGHQPGSGARWILNASTREGPLETAAGLSMVPDVKLFGWGVWVYYGDIASTSDQALSDRWELSFLILAVPSAV